MSPQQQVLTGAQRRSRRRARVRGLQPAVLGWLTLVWVALWGELSLFNVVAGLLVAAGVCLVFPLPPLRLHVRIRPVRLGWLVLHFLADVVRASVQVAWTTLQLHRMPRNAVIGVQLRTSSDFVLTVVAEMTSLVPGSLVVEARRSTSTLYLHVLDARDQAGVERMRRDVLALERRVVLAFGTETHQVEEPPTGTGSATAEEG
jgi:multicomponent Na+:H+ antiporter subunit E